MIWLLTQCFKLISFLHIYYHYNQRCQITFTRATYQHLEFFPLPWLLSYLSLICPCRYTLQAATDVILTCVLYIRVQTGFIELWQPYKAVLDKHALKQNITIQWNKTRQQNKASMILYVLCECCAQPNRPGWAIILHISFTLNACLKLVHGQVTIIFLVYVCLFVCLSVCLFVCLFVQFFSAVFDPISIKLGHMLYVWL